MRKYRYQRKSSKECMLKLVKNHNFAPKNKFIFSFFRYFCFLTHPNYVIAILSQFRFKIIIIFCALYKHRSTNRNMYNLCCESFFLSLLKTWLWKFHQKEQAFGVWWINLRLCKISSVPLCTFHSAVAMQH